MLVLQRSQNEGVALFDTAGNQLGTITVLTDHKYVKLGFEMNPEITVLRSELDANPSQVAEQATRRLASC